MSPVRPHTNVGAVLFLGLMLAGALMLTAGSVDVPPACAGVVLPERPASYVSRSPLSASPAGPGHRGAPHQEETEPVMEQVQTFIDQSETTANSALDQGHFFIQLYGGLQDLLGRTYVEDADPRYSVVKLSDGTLTFVNSEPMDVTGHGRSVARLADVLEDRDIPLFYVQAPQKLQAEDPRLPHGVEDYGDSYADQLLAVLEENEVASLDLRETFAATGRPWSSFFFDTDHHWTPEAAFLAYQAISQVLSEDYGFQIDPAWTDPGSYTRTTYSDYFLGSQGKRVGTLYGGVDDIELWAPTFKTQFTYSIPIYDMERTGPFEESLLFPERIEEVDYFNGNPYTLYAGGDYPMARIYNEENTGGKRILLLRDSYACALTPFLALDCGELITIDLRYFRDDLLTYVDWLDPDLVMVMYTAGSVGLEELFAFFPQTDMSQSLITAQPPAVQKPDM